MTIKAMLENAATAVTALCAILVAVVVARREFFRPPDPNSPQPVLVKTWQAYAVGDERIGPDNAPVTVVVFSDFQCAACREFASRLSDITAKHPGELVVIHRNFPLEAIHPYARSAAVAAECAASQGRFAEYHDYLFAHQDSLGAFDWAAAAARVGVANIKVFRQCLRSEAAAGKLARDSIAGRALAITGVPWFMIDGRGLVGAPPEPALEDQITKQIRKLHQQERTKALGARVAGSSRTALTTLNGGDP